MILLTVGIYSILAPDVIKAIRIEVVSVVLGYNNWWQISENADYFTRMANQSPFTHLWFLGIELQYYLLWPLLFGLYVAVSRVLSPQAGTFLFLAGGVAAMGIMPFDFGEGMNMTRLYYGTDTRIYALLLGGALGFYLARRTLSKEMGTFRKSGVSLLYFLALLFTGAGYVVLDGQFPQVYQWAMGAYTLVFLLLLLWTADSRLPFGQLMDNPLFRWIGKYSYGIFLWQYPVIFLFRYMKWESCHALCHGSAGASAYPSSLGVDGASFRASFRPFPALSSPEKNGDSGGSHPSDFPARLSLHGLRVPGHLEFRRQPGCGYG